MGSIGKRYSKEFRDDCVNYYYLNKDKGIKSIADVFGLADQTLRSWIKRNNKKEEIFSDNSLTTEKEIILKLKIELEQVKSEREILKKALSIFCKDGII